MLLSVVSVADCDAELRGEVTVIKVHSIASRAIPYRTSCIVLWRVVSFGQKDTYRPIASLVFHLWRHSPSLSVGSGQARGPDPLAQDAVQVQHLLGTVITVAGFVIDMYGLQRANFVVVAQ
jgi:hypothetical protein